MLLFQVLFNKDLLNKLLVIQISHKEKEAITHPDLILPVRGT